MVYKSLKEICQMAEESGVPFWQVIQRDDCTERQVEPSESFEQMRKMYLAMKHADEMYTGTRKSNSGMVGGDGKKLEQYIGQGMSFDDICLEIEAYKQNIVETLEKNAAERAEAELEDALVQKVVDASECDIPEAMIEEQSDDSCFLTEQPEGQFVRGH